MDIGYPGFTLIEVLVALLVFAVVAFAVSARIGELANQTFSIERRMAAHWVAQNAMVRLQARARLDEQTFATGRTKERITSGDRNWIIALEIADTTHPWMRRVDVSVSLMEGDREVGPIDQLTGFIGRH